MCKYDSLARSPIALAFSLVFTLNLASPVPGQEGDWAQREFWETTTGQPVPAGWQFENGEITLIDPKQASSIVSQPMPSNFDLAWEWKIEKGVNSGLKYRVRRFGKHLFNNNFLGLEFQIIDSPPNSTSKSSTASIYALVEPIQDKTLHPPGQWNSSRIVANGDTVEHYLNGKLVASGVTSGANWETKIALSKFYGGADFGRPKNNDRFMLTDHGGKVAYRNFRFIALNDVTPPALETAESQESSSDGPFLANATRNSWADQDSIVIWTRTTQNAEMNLEGQKFLPISTKEARKLAEQTDEDALLKAQLPAGAQLADMFGACPGAPGRVRLAYFVGRPNRITYTDWIETKATSDFTAQWKLSGLTPGTEYTTVIEAQTPDGTPSAVLRGTFRTAPKLGKTENLRFCITTCHDFIRRDDGNKGHKIYPAMETLKPDFVVHAGDIEYYDKPDPWAVTKSLMRFKWGRIFSLPSNRAFYNSTTSYFIKDDHDTLSNDSWPGRTYGSVTFDEGVQIFNEEQFPSRDPRYANIRWGRDLEIWILEGRDYRSPNNSPDGPEKTILGATQKAWLFESLETSQAKFKLILSPTPIVGPDRDNKKDNHANEVFAYEGREIRDRLAKIPGVLIFCGDRHWQYASVDEQAKLWEFGCGPGSEKHQFGWKKGDQRPNHRFLRVAGGFLSGELQYSDSDDGKMESMLIIRHHDVHGQEVSAFQFPTTSKEPPHKDAN